MTTTELIKKLNSLAEIGIVNAKEDTAVLLEAADRLYELRAKADPKWSDWLILDEAAFVASINGDECEMTTDKDAAISFLRKEDADAWLDGGAFEKIGGGVPVLRGDCDANGLLIFFNGVL